MGTATEGLAKVVAWLTVRKDKPYAKYSNFKVTSPDAGGKEYYCASALILVCARAHTVLFKPSKVLLHRPTDIREART
ncbi:hypothetical protein M404DRAFT_994645 [Pisolithus tinctorius Marx 270]|uniref:Uncharacterized protein n=1 Tax=Pisolithus tinctorius Marx 270 TaxID=870435 RepID=A0A0C3PTB9_PISTI|nr:hypothetical protein M404DRAFT_994645 [Pisolithus tinctorius Marx 270]